jgi:hypothetical protein
LVGDLRLRQRIDRRKTAARLSHAFEAAAGGSLRLRDGAAPVVQQMVYYETPDAASGISGFHVSEACPTITLDFRTNQDIRFKLRPLIGLLYFDAKFRCRIRARFTGLRGIDGGQTVRAQVAALAPASAVNYRRQDQLPIVR